VVVVSAAQEKGGVGASQFQGQRKRSFFFTCYTLISKSVSREFFKYLYSSDFVHDKDYSNVRILTTIV
jgi:hypothetical protein